jgi:hypothetical protein
MSRKNQIPKEWGEELAKKLQQHYGLAEDEARKKVEVWFQSHQAHRPKRNERGRKNGL